MGEWCHRLKDGEAAVPAVVRHLGETPMHVKDCLHDHLCELLHLFGKHCNAGEAMLPC